MVYLGQETHGFVERVISEEVGTKMQHNNEIPSRVQDCIMGV